MAPPKRAAAGALRETARDPGTLAAVAAVLTLICLAAMLVPTRRFGRIEPMKVLRVR